MKLQSKSYNTELDSQSTQNELSPALRSKRCFIEDLCTCDQIEHFQGPVNPYQAYY